MPYPRYSGTGNSSGGVFGRDEQMRIGRSSGQVSPWQNAPNTGGGFLGNANVNQQSLALAGNLLGSLLGAGGGGGGNTFLNTPGTNFRGAGLAGPAPMNYLPMQADDRRNDRYSSRGRRSSPPHSRRSGGGYMKRSRSRSPRGRGGPNSDRRSFKRTRDRSPPPNRPDYEIYIGNYPVEFKESDIRKLFEEHKIEVKQVRLKYLGKKVYGFAETTSKEEVEKAIKSLDNKEIKGRRLKVRSAKDQERKRQSSPVKSTKRKDPTVNDISPHLAVAFIAFLERELEEVGMPEDKSTKIKKVQTLLKETFDLPKDEEALKIYQVNRALELSFLQSNRREIKLPPTEEEKKAQSGKSKDKPKKAKKEKDEKKINDEEEDDEDNGNWKRRKVSKKEEEVEEAEEVDEVEEGDEVEEVEEAEDIEEEFVEKDDTNEIDEDEEVVQEIDEDVELIEEDKKEEAPEPEESSEGEKAEVVEIDEKEKEDSEELVKEVVPAPTTPKTVKGGVRGRGSGRARRSRGRKL